MIVVQLAGGFGNQMFQYALARNVAHRRKEKLLMYVDTPLFHSPGTQISPDILRYGLDVFNINAQLTTLEQLRKDPVGVVWTIAEAGSGYCADVLAECQYHRNVGLLGFWQSYKYFDDIPEIIRNDFSFSSGYLNPHDSAVSDAILKCNSVCVHIRRGDYLRPQDTKGFVGVPYYERAVTLLVEELDSPQLFVFSDDVAWCKDNLRFQIPTTFVEPAPSTTPHAADDFYLMSQCRHFVIANSTYSWWAAWLSTHDTKLVIAPQRWYRWEGEPGKTTTYLLSDDLVPDNWIRV